MRKTASIAILSALFLSVSTLGVASASSLPQILNGSSKFAAVDNTAKTQTGNKNATNSDQAKQTASPTAATPAPDKVITVQSGDTLIGLANANQTTYQRLFDANTVLTDPNVINPGQQLTVPSDSEQLPDRISALPQATQAAVASAASAYSATTTVATTSYPAVGGNDAKAFIYSRESGNNPNATNASGCYGLGQDCNGRVRAQCGADYACQDAYFTNYAVSRYGGWSQAAAFWQTHGWW